MKKFLALSAIAVFFLFSCSPFTGNTESILTAQSSSSRSVAAPVELISATTRFVNLGHAVLIGLVEGTVEVANFSSTKEVGVHYSIDGGEWQDGYAQYVETLDNGREKWIFSIGLFEIPYTDSPMASNVVFAVNMSANGETYWDNNAGSDYGISSEGTGALYAPVALGKDAVKITYAHYGSVYPAGTVLSLEAVVKNIDFAKDLDIVYTTDNWATTKVANMFFLEDFDGRSELWMGAPVISPYIRGAANQSSASSVEFCVAYNVSGQTYWDSNLGQNYILQAGESYNF